MKRKQSGFTLVEIAIVLVIIGLLLGGILKGQELINSARVRNMGDLSAGIQASYYGFIDRYRQVPGDWKKTNAEAAIGVTINGGGDQNGRLDQTWTEVVAVWEHLSKAGFISGTYEGDDDGTDYPTGTESPINPFNGPVILYRDSDYLDNGTAVDRLNLTLGINTPVDIALEMDTKLDDAKPFTGVVRGALRDGTGGSGTFAALSEQDTACVNVATGGAEYWDVAANSSECNVVFLY